MARWSIEEVAGTFTAEYWDRRTDLRELLGHLCWATQQIWAAAPGPALVLAVGQVAEGLAPAAQLYGIKRLIDAVVGTAGQGGEGFAALVPWMAVLVVALVVGGAAGRQLRGPIRHRLDHRVQFALQRRRLIKAAQLPLLFFEDSASYDMLSRSEDPGFKTTRYAIGALSFGSGVLNLGSVALLFWPASPWLTLGLLAATVPQALRAAEDSRRWMRLMYGQTEEQRKAAYIDSVIVGRGEQKEVRTFALAPALQRRWRELRLSLRAEAAAERRVMAVRGIGPNAFEYAVATAAVFALAMALAHHRLSVGGFAALFGAVGQLQSAAGTLTYTLRDMRPDAADVRYVRDFLALAEDRPRAGTVAFPTPLHDGIRLEGVSFAYPGRDTPVLREVDLLLRSGERVALVGENGAGKSTLVKLLLGLYRPMAGRITADGVDYAEIAASSLHDGVAAAFQDFHNFEFTAAQSIGIGRPAAFGGPEGLDPDPFQVERAARLGGAHDFVADLPAGYATPVGHVFDGGQGLSGGQWQRLAVSRTFMRDPQLLILDEPTAALDPRAEADVYARFTDLLRGRAGLLVSHRLGSARLCDRILVLKGGRIVEQGRHDDLLAAGGEYARMWEEQAQWYR